MTVVFEYAWSVLNMAHLWLNTPDDPVFTTAQQVRDQLKCAGSDLVYWEGWAAQHEGWSMEATPEGIFLHVPHEETDSVDLRIWVRCLSPP